MVSLVLAGLAVAVSIGAWSHQPRRGPAHAAHPPAAAQRAPGFTLPPATVAWVDYSGGLHIGDVATRAQHVAGTIPAWAGAGRLVQAGARIYGADINQDAAPVREYDIATGKIRYLAPGNSVFTSADGRHLYIARTGTRLIELPADGTGTARQLALPPAGTCPASPATGRWPAASSSTPATPIRAGPPSPWPSGTRRPGG